MLAFDHPYFLTVDFDANGVLSAGDIDLLATAIRAGSADLQFDVNIDASVNDLDHAYWVDTIRRTYSGDSNLDGQFTTSDLVAVFQADKYERNRVASWSEGDWNGDGLFGTSDLVDAFQRSGYERPYRVLSAPLVSVSVLPSEALSESFETHAESVHLSIAADPFTKVTLSNGGVGYIAHDGTLPASDIPLDIGLNTIAGMVEDINGQIVQAAPVDITRIARQLNRPPEVSETFLSFVLDEDTTLDLTDGPKLLDGVSDADDDPLSIVLVDDVKFGSLDLDVSGTFRYTPAANYSGTEAFSFRISDGTNYSAVVQAMLEVRPVNDAPVATELPSRIETDQDTAVEFAVRSFFADVDDLVLALQVANQPAHGTLTLDAQGNARYSPVASFYGDDQFSLVASDGQLTSSPTTFSTFVRPIDTSPVAPNVTFEIDEDERLVVPFEEGFVAISHDPDGDQIIAGFVPESPGNSLPESNRDDEAHFQYEGDGSFVYIPQTNFHGVVSFPYYVIDEDLRESNVATATIIVHSVFDLPELHNDYFEVAQDMLLQIPGGPEGILANDLLGDVTDAQIQLLQQPLHGTLTESVNDGQTDWLYTPNAGFFGFDSIEYTISDGVDQFEIGLITFEVTRREIIEFDDVTGVLTVRGGVTDDYVSFEVDNSNNVKVQYSSNLAGPQVDQERTIPVSSVKQLRFFGYDGEDQFYNNTDIPSVAYGEVLFGGMANDYLSLEDAESGGWASGSFGDDVIIGSEVEDLIEDLGGDDLLQGRGGGDTYYLFMADHVQGTKVIDDDQGDNVLSLDANSGVRFDLNQRVNQLAENYSVELISPKAITSIVGSFYDDYFIGHVDQPTTIFGRQGNDVLVGGNLGDMLWGEEGNDQLFGNDGDDTLNGGLGNNVLFGGNGVDLFSNGIVADPELISYTETRTITRFGSILATIVINGTEQADFATTNVQRLAGGVTRVQVHVNGQDFIRDIQNAYVVVRFDGKGGDDYFEDLSSQPDTFGVDANGGLGNDTLIGGAGPDVLVGGQGDDLLRGGGGNDILNEQTDELGSNTLFGDAGDDLLLGGSSNDTIHGGNDNDQIYAYLGADLLEGGHGDDTIDGGRGGDTYVFNGESLGHDTLIEADTNVDTLDFSTFLHGINVRLGASTPQDVAFGQLRLTLPANRFERIIGTAYNDSVEGSSRSEFIWGATGNDTINGGGGNDFIWGDAGDDSIEGGLGADILYGGDGNDRLDGGNPVFEGGVDDHASDTLLGGDGNDSLFGYGGNDRLLGETGDDQLDGGRGNDTLDGGPGDDILDGGVGEDELRNGTNLVDSFSLTPAHQALFSASYLKFRHKYLNQFLFGGMSGQALKETEIFFGDQGLFMGFAMETFAGEVELFRRNGLDTSPADRVLREILKGFELMETADLALYGVDVPGFFVRDAISNEDRLGVPANWAVFSDYRFENGNRLSDSPMSSDQAIHLFMGWRAIAQWSNDSENIRLAREYTERVMDFLIGSGWIFSRPDGESISSDRGGGDMRALAGFFSKIADQVLGEDRYFDSDSNLVYIREFPVRTALVNALQSISNDAAGAVDGFMAELGVPSSVEIQIPVHVLHNLVLDVLLPTLLLTGGIAGNVSLSLFVPYLPNAIGEARIHFPVVEETTWWTNGIDATGNQVRWSTTSFNIVNRSLTVSELLSATSVPVGLALGKIIDAYDESMGTFPNSFTINLTLIAMAHDSDPRVRFHMDAISTSFNHPFSLLLRSIVFGTDLRTVDLKRLSEIHSEVPSGMLGANRPGEWVATNRWEWAIEYLPDELQIKPGSGRDLGPESEYNRLDFMALEILMRLYFANA